MNNWKKFEKRIYDPFIKDVAPFDGHSFLACIWGEWIGEAVYARHYDYEPTGNRPPGKYEFFYVISNPEEFSWKIKLEEEDFPITHWMPLPEPPND